MRMSLLAIDSGERLSEMLVRRSQFCPIGRRLWIAIDDSGDGGLVGVTLVGCVRAAGLSPEGSPTDLLVELEASLGYAGHYKNSEIRWVVTRPCLRWRRTSRILFSWAVARVVDAPSFVDSTFDRTIGIARIGLI